MQATTLTVNTSYEGETLEQKLHRIVNNGEDISEGAPIIYTERKDGVLPAYDIRTDRFEVAIEGKSKIHKSDIANREERHKPTEEKKGDSGAESIQGTENQQK